MTGPGLFGVSFRIRLYDEKLSARRIGELGNGSDLGFFHTDELDPMKWRDRHGEYFPFANTSLETFANN